MICTSTWWKTAAALLPFALLVLPSPAAAQNSRPARPAGSQPAEATTAAFIQEANAEESVTRHSITVNSRRLDYKAVAGFLPIRDEAGKVQAKMFYVAYTLDGRAASGRPQRDLGAPIGDDANRPITFAFNGGPGAASLWLHMGAMGPKRVLLADDGKAMPAKIELVDNESTWLDFTDLVFIDPIGSGYSSAAPGVDEKQFFGVDGDVRSIGEFIRLYVTKNGRWLSPKFLAGESYGATRSAPLANHLHGEAGMDMAGLVLLSSALNFQTFTFARGNDLPCVLYAPTYAAVAWYHHRLPADLQKDLASTLEEVERWSVEEYGPALAAGDKLPEARRKKIADALHRYTGLDEAYIQRSNLRVSSWDFAGELLRDQGKVVGTLDGRVAGFPLDPIGGPDYDPSLFLVSGPFSAAIQDYIRADLGFRCDERYVFLSSKANQSWNWGPASRGFVNVTGDLHRAMTENPNLKVFAGMSTFDLTTGYFAQEYALAHLGLPQKLLGNITRSRYPSGHQIYNHLPSLKQLSLDVARFVKDRSSVTATQPAESASQPAER